MTSEAKPPSLQAWALLILVSVIWGSSFILIKKGLITFSAWEVGTLRISIACLALFPFAIRAFSKIDRSKLPFLFIVGGVGSFIPALLFAWAQTRLDSAIAGVVNSFVPIFVILIGYVFFKKGITRLSAVGIFLGFFGCVFVMLGGANFDLRGVNYYALLILAATVMYAANVNIIKYFLPDIKALHITSASFVLISPFCIGYLFLATDFLDKASSHPQFWQGMAYVATLGAVGTAFAMFVFNSLVKMASPVFASSCTYLIPIVSIAWGLIDGEILNIYQYIGMAVILSGVWLANKK